MLGESTRFLLDKLERAPIRTRNPHKGYLDRLCAGGGTYNIGLEGGISADDDRGREKEVARGGQCGGDSPKSNQSQTYSRKRSNERVVN